MRQLILLLAVVFSLKAFPQFNTCFNGSPIPTRLLSDQEEFKLKKINDSLIHKNGSRISYFNDGDTTIETRKEFKNLLRTLIASAKDLAVDSFSKYEIIFREDLGWNTRGGLSHSSSSYSLNKQDTVVNAIEFYSKLRKLPLEFFNLQSYSYGKLYLIIKVCDQYIGENSWGWTTVYYGKKILPLK